MRSPWPCSAPNDQEPREETQDYIDCYESWNIINGMQNWSRAPKGKSCDEEMDLLTLLRKQAEDVTKTSVTHEHEETQGRQRFLVKHRK